MECLYDGARLIWEHADETDAAGSGPDSSWGTCWLVELIISESGTKTDFLPHTKTALFDSYSLFADMFTHPALYLNGTAPLNVTGCINPCVYQLNQDPSTPGECTMATGSARDSFLWSVGLLFGKT